MAFDSLLKGSGATASAHRAARTRTLYRRTRHADYAGSDTVGMHKTSAEPRLEPAIIMASA